MAKIVTHLSVEFKWWFKPLMILAIIINSERLVEFAGKHGLTCKAVFE